MENETPMMVVTCPSCAKKMRMKNPQKAGVYRLTCPFCNKPFPVKIVDKAEPKNAEPKPAAPPVPPTPATPPVPPTPQPQPEAAKDDEPVVVQYCSSCGMKLRIRNPQVGQHSVRCPKCQSVQTYTYGAPASSAASAQPTPPPAPQPVNKTKPVQGNYNLATGCLVQSRGLFRSDTVYPLAGKETIIGRRDTTAPCDVMIDDPTMSRRSVSITAEAKNKGITYKFTVLNASNKVFHNGTPLSVGSSVYLNFGDTLVLGRTKLKFQKAEEQR